MKYVIKLQSGKYFARFAGSRVVEVDSWRFAAQWGAYVTALAFAKNEFQTGFTVEETK